MTRTFWDRLSPSFEQEHSSSNRRTIFPALCCWTTGLVFFTLLQSFPALAQQAAGSADPGLITVTAESMASGQQRDAKGPQSDQQDKTGGPSQSGTSDDRLFYALPNFLTLENVGHIPPLTAGQKFKVVARASFDPVEYPWYGALAGLSQATDGEHGFGQGAAGYGKRYGATFADGTIDNFMTGAILPSLLRQDPRYYQLGKGSFFHRTGYAISRMFITRADSGGRQFNYSEVFGSGIAGALANLYHPREDRDLSGTMGIWATDIGWDSLTAIVREFWPDMRRWIHKNKP